MDGATVPSNLLHPNSDAAKYMREASVFPRLFIDLLGDIPHLSNPNAFRLAGSVGSPDIEGRSMMTISGEPNEPVSRRTKLFSRTQTASDPEGKIRYGLDIIPAVSAEEELDPEAEPKTDEERGELVEVYIGGKKVSSYKQKNQALGMYTEDREIRISRLVGNIDEDSLLHTLGLVGISSNGAPVFRTPEALDDPKSYNHLNDNPAQRIELAQIIAACADAAEWAFD